MRRAVHCGAWTAMVTMSALMTADSGDVQMNLGVLALLGMLAYASRPEGAPPEAPRAQEGAEGAELSADVLAEPGGQWGSARRDSAVWRCGDEVEIVRWDPVIMIYFLNGEAWPDAGMLAIKLAEMECRGYRMQADAQSLAIREALGLGGWWAMLEGD